MEQVFAFIDANLWLCVGFGVIGVVVLDEALGVSRAVLGDDAPRMRRREETADDPPAEAPPVTGEAVEDLIPRRPGS